MRSTLILSFICLLFGFSSCTEEALMSPVPTTAAESTLSFAFNTVEQTCGFGCTGGLIAGENTSMERAHPQILYTQTFFLTVEDVTDNGKTKGTSNMIQFTVSNRSGAPINSLQMNFDSHPSTTRLNGELALVSCRIVTGMNFETGTHRNAVSVTNGWLTLSTDSRTGEQTIWLDAKTRTGQKLRGKWSGMMEEVEVPFL